jgi:hypothetical protein
LEHPHSSQCEQERERAHDRTDHRLSVGPPDDQVDGYDQPTEKGEPLVESDDRRTGDGEAMGNGGRMHEKAGGQRPNADTGRPMMGAREVERVPGRCNQISYG